jgi:hypothetical protein
MKHLILILSVILYSCGTIHHVSDKIEEPHYALYRQKVLLVHSVKAHKVYFINPQGTRYYYLKGRRYSEQWAPGDTFFIDSNLASFYNLRFIDKPDN